MRSFNKFFPPDVMTFTSGRRINFVLPKDGTVFNKQQKNFLQSVLKKSLPRMINIRQIHGRRVILAAPQYLRKNQITEADGAVTNLPNLPLAVRTADCLSAFIFDPPHKAIGLVHAGWKGTRKEIIPNAIRLLIKKFGTRPADLKIAFGPSIRSCCYQVGEEFKRYFPKEVKQTPRGLYLDLPLANKRQLVALGVKSKNILDQEQCTCCSKNFFSYRRDGKKAGRMISVMMLNENQNLKRKS